MESDRFDLIVVGAGISGMTAAAAAASQGLRVGLVNTGLGQFVFGAGCIESRQPLANEAPQVLEEAIAFFCAMTRHARCPFHGGLGVRRHLPTIMGSFQTVALAPFSLWTTDTEEPSRAAVVGIKGLSSFDATFTAERLAFNARRLDVNSSYVGREISLSTEAGTVASTLQFANRFDRDPNFRTELLDALRPVTRDGDLIILPGMLGLRSKLREISEFESALGRPLCELPTLPPSVPGLRLFHALEEYLRKAGIEFFSGFPVGRLEMGEGHCAGVCVDVPGRPLHLRAKVVVLASGPFSTSLLGADFFGTDGRLRPIRTGGALIADNLYATGALLSSTGGQGGNERAILTGYRAGMLAAGEGERYAAE